MLKLKKSLGQHLLVSQGVLEEIAKRAEITSEDILVEIGPGLGHLTRALLAYPFKKLYLLEIDKNMLQYLSTTIKDKGVILLEGDATCFNYASLNEKKLKVLGNLPYNVASLIVENVVKYYELIPQALFMVQKEVAEKWISGKSWLSLYIYTFYDMHYLMTIPPKFFRPPPKVDSALISLKANLKYKIEDLAHYKKFLTTLFHQKRKMLRKKFSETLLKEAGFMGTERVEELTIREVLTLYQHFQTWLSAPEK